MLPAARCPGLRGGGRGNGRLMLAPGSVVLCALFRGAGALAVAAKSPRAETTQLASQLSTSPQAAPQIAAGAVEKCGPREVPLTPPRTLLREPEGAVVRRPRQPAGTRPALSLPSQRGFHTAPPPCPHTAHH